MAPDLMDGPTKQRLRAAADRAVERHPGPVGELLAQELHSWMVFGHRLGATLILRVADDLLEHPVQPTDKPAATGAGQSGDHPDRRGRPITR